MRSNSYGRLAGKEETEAIISLAQQFDKNLNGKSFLICFGTKTLRFLEVSFSAGNLRPDKPSTPERYRTPRKVGWHG